MIMDANAEVFREELTKILLDAKDQNKEYIDVISGDLHRKVGGYPSKDHKMPTCCAVMKSMMNLKDEIIYQPPKGRGATLHIRYYLSY